MMRIRDKIFQQFKQSESQEIYYFYKQFRNRVVNELKNSKTKYFQNYFTENKSNMKLQWQGISAKMSSSVPQTALSLFEQGFHHGTNKFTLDMYQCYANQEENQISLAIQEMVWLTFY